MENQKKRDYTEGVNFWKWLFSPMNVCVVLFNLVIFIGVLINFQDIKENNPTWLAWSVACFNPLVLAIFSFKTWQHWNDLKNGRTR